VFLNVCSVVCYGIASSSS